MADPQKDEHIEELLSKLQGIFGKLSHSEEEDIPPKIEISRPAPKEPEIKTPPPTPAPPETPPPFKPPEPAPFNFFSLPPDVPPHPPVPPSGAPPVPSSAPPPAPSATPVAPPVPAAAPLTSSAVYETTVPLEDPEKMIVPSAVLFPPGRETEARTVAQKLEIMTPKFTKVAFRLRIIVFMPYDPKSEWKDLIVAKAAEAHFQSVFVVMDRPLDDVRRKAIAAELEGKGVYFQEVPTASIEKKAFYTDILLGLVFFFDSHKPSAGPEPPAA